ncbi:MAG: phosphatidate cytidylyltransferase, partial [Acidimicrobiales bacterium]
ALSLAAGETFGALRRSGFRPLSLFGLVATAAAIVFAYLKGPVADPVVLAGLVVLCGSALVVSTVERSAVEDLGVTVLVVTWIGVLGSFAALLVNPTTFPNRHGVAFLGAVVGITVAHDIGSYVVGSRIGRHRFVPRVSPGKTIEGLFGGSALALLVAGLLVARVHPMTVAASLGLAAVVIVFAPLGDLVQSLVKRDLGLKDMGRMLPAHGGISDRIDSMLFVLPAAFVFFRLVHLG